MSRRASLVNHPRHVGDLAAGPALVHGPLQVPAGQVGDRVRAEAGVRIDQLIVHPASVRRPDRRRLRSSPQAVHGKAQEISEEYLKQTIFNKKCDT